MAAELSKISSYRIVHGHALDAIKSLPNESCSLVVSSPPYNIGKSYEKNNPRTLEEYRSEFTVLAAELITKLKPSGSLCWQVGNFVDEGEIFPLDFLFYELFKKFGLLLRNRIIWRFDFGLNSQKRFSGRYETLLWFTKSDQYTFNLDPVRVPQKYPGKRHSSKKGEKAGRLSGNPKGKNPSDFWQFSAEESFFKNPIWEFPNVKANHPEKTIHPCQFPVELAERCVLALTRPGDIVLDPFLGTGTSVIAAVKNGRRGIGVDTERKYVDLARERVKQALRGNLAIRPSGTPVWVPTDGQKVARIPDEWNPAFLEMLNGQSN